MKIKITILGLLWSIMSYSQGIPPVYSTQSDDKNKTDVLADQNRVYSDVDQAAEFPGGINSLRSKFASAFKSSKIKAAGNISTVVSFIVEEDGSISNVKADGSNSQFNTEAVRVIKSIKNKWAPAKMNGEVVRSAFRIPLKMNFE